MTINRQRRPLSTAFALLRSTVTGIAAALWINASAAQTFPVTVTDDNQRAVTLEQSAERIVSLAPSLTELLFSIGAGERIRGVMAFSDFPPQAQQLPIVGQYDSLDIERIIALQPDLIVAWRSGNPRGALQRLQELGYTVYIAEPESLDSIADHMLRLGQLTGLHNVADELARQFRSQLAQLRATYGQRAPVRVFYQVWHAPMVSVGGAELINDMITVCGGQNIFSELPKGPRVNLEDVLQRNPQVIIASGSDRQMPAWLDDWRQWQDLDATRHHQLYAIAPDLVQRHSLRAMQGTRQLCQHIDQARQSIR